MPTRPCEICLGPITYGVPYADASCRACSKAGRIPKSPMEDGEFGADSDAMVESGYALLSQNPDAESVPSKNVRRRGFIGSLFRGRYAGRGRNGTKTQEVILEGGSGSEGGNSDASGDKQDKQPPPSSSRGLQMAIFLNLPPLKRRMQQNVQQPGKKMATDNTRNGWYPGKPVECGADDDDDEDDDYAPFSADNCYDPHGLEAQSDATDKKLLEPELWDEADFTAGSKKVTNRRSELLQRAVATTETTLLFDGDDSDAGTEEWETLECRAEDTDCPGVETAPVMLFHGINVDDMLAEAMKEVGL